jgi:hypothetical protein
MSKVKILVAEDEKIIAFDLKTSLEKLGYEVIDVLSSGEEVIEKLPLLRVDLILMDIKLKGEFDGIKTAYLIKQNYEIPVVYLTSYADKFTLKRIQMTQPFGYLLKPFKESELNSVIEIALHNFRSEKKLKENERLLQNYKDIFDNSPIGIFQSNIDKKLITVNRALIKMLGYNTVDEFLRIDISNDLYFNPAERDEKIWSSLKESQHGNLEIKWKRKDGSPIWVQLNIETITDKAGNPLHHLGFVTNINEKKKTEEELQQQEKSYKSLIESSIDAIYVFQDDKFVLVNPAWEKLFGYSFSEASQPTFKLLDIIDPEYHSLIRERIEKRKENISLPSTYELCGRTKNETKIDLEVSVNKIQWKGKPAIQGIYRNITERKNSEKALRESEERFRQLAENVRDIFIVTDLDNTKVFYVSPVIEEVTGFKAGAFYENPLKCFDIIHPDDKQPAVYFAEQITKTGLYDYEHRIIKKDGKISWIRFRAFPIKDKDNNIYRVASIIEDITDRKYWEEQILKLSKAVKQSPAIILITDTKSIIEYVNPKFTHVTGYKPEEVLGKKPNILKGRNTSEEEYNKLWDTLFSGKEWQGEFLNRKKNGEPYWVSASISPIIDDQGKITHFIAIQEDITERKRNEELLIIAKEDAEKSDKLKSEFLAQMSHEIRTPLNNILTYTSLLQEELEGKLPEDLESVFPVIGSSAQRLIRTIDLILNLAKIQTGNYETNFEKIDLDKDILYDIVLEFYSRAKLKGLEIIYENSNLTKTIFGDRYAIGQIFVNLIDNAVKYTNSGKINVRLYGNGNNHIKVDVADTGIGISNNFLPSIFEPFTQEDYSTTRNYEGTGLGLAIVKKYVEINNAGIDIKSIKGKGTTFTVTFRTEE